MSCSLGKSSIKTNKYEVVYSTSLNQSQRTTVRNLLMENFSDFPKTNKKKIKYMKNIENNYLKIMLENDKFKLEYRGNDPLNKNINDLRSKIEKLTSE